MQQVAVPDMTEIAIQEKLVELAQDDVEQLSVGVDPLMVSDLTRTELNVAKLHAEIAEAQIIAPFGGKLLTVSLTPGQAVDAFRSTVVLADLSDMEVSADLISSQLEDLAEGMPVSIILVSRPGVQLTGDIRRLPYPMAAAAAG
ncbi:MAG: HlyD family efflux transporter periplasmic adaptor subunit, partial [Caldilineaceae bacterium]|nr:HlyD family efflux transporter periplasmic adaptor subunit [Caldilineaceae bacterium]